MRINDDKNGQKTISMALWKAASIVGATFLITVIGTAFTLINVLNSDHFTIVANARRLDAIEAQYVHQDVWAIQMENINDKLDTLKGLVNGLYKIQ